MQTTRLAETMIERELSFGDIIQRTFDIYQRNFIQYLTIFLVAETVIGVISAALQYFIILPVLPSNPTPAQVFTWLPGFFGMLFTLVFGLILASAIFGTIAAGTSVKIASEIVENKRIDLGEAIRYTVNKLFSIWGLSILVFTIVFLGVIALVIPGLIFALMFSLAFPVLLIENTGITQSMSRSRQLVSGRWLKSTAVYLTIGIVTAVGSGIVSLLTSPIGIGYVRNTLDNILSAFYLPIIPIALTVFYYSNRARLSSVPAMNASGYQPTTPVGSTARFCPSCGEAMTQFNQAYCRKCGFNLGSFQH